MTRHDGLSAAVPEYARLRMAGVGAPVISVVLPTFNRKATLFEAIGSVLALNEGELELIVVDDGSTDGSGIGLLP